LKNIGIRVNNVNGFIGGAKESVEKQKQFEYISHAADAAARIRR
jgi:hypothetical protein